MAEHSRAELQAMDAIARLPKLFDRAIVALEQSADASLKNTEELEALRDVIQQGFADLNHAVRFAPAGVGGPR